MIDWRRRTVTITQVGREDRALLRSTPSARSDAGTWTGTSPFHEECPSPPSLFWPESEKPRGSGGRAPRNAVRAVCHMSTSRG